MNWPIIKNCCHCFNNCWCTWVPNRKSTFQRRIQMTQWRELLTFWQTFSIWDMWNRFHRMYHRLLSLGVNLTHKNTNTNSFTLPLWTGHECNSNEFSQGILHGDRKILYPILFQILERVEDYKTKVYLSKFLVEIKVPNELFSFDGKSHIYHFIMFCILGMNLLICCFLRFRRCRSLQSVQAIIGTI